jgi:hypothetical protein
VVTTTLYRVAAHVTGSPVFEHPDGAEQPGVDSCLSKDTRDVQANAHLRRGEANTRDGVLNGGEVPRTELRYREGGEEGLSIEVGMDGGQAPALMAEISDKRCPLLK